MSFGFLGRLEDRICLYSQLTGVVPEYQSQGLGHAIKMVQRDMAHAEGVDLIAWAFDPLQSGNAPLQSHPPSTGLAATSTTCTASAPTPSTRVFRRIA